MWFWIRSPSQKRKRIRNHWLCCNEMVPPSWIACRRWLRKVNWHVGCSLHHVWADWWKSIVSGIKWTGSTFSHSKVFRAFASRSPWKVYKKPKVFGHEIPLDSNFGPYWQEILWQNMSKRLIIHKVTPKAESKRKNDSKISFITPILWRLTSKISRATINKLGFHVN